MIDRFNKPVAPLSMALISKTLSITISIIINACSEGIVDEVSV
jgi:hypothetical protein